MVDKSSNQSSVKEPMPFCLTIILFDQNGCTSDALLATLKPEFDAIDSKRVSLQVTPTRNQLEFHLTARDVKALRAASNSLLRLVMVAEGVLHLTMRQISGEENE
jgi:tRNA threonylcarbamoyladenosine modification (KEOPS) complex  Pcc1 subunit